MKFIPSNPERFGSEGKWKSTSVPSRHVVPINIDFLSAGSVTSAEVFAVVHKRANRRKFVRDYRGVRERGGAHSFPNLRPRSSAR